MAKYLAPLEWLDDHASVSVTLCKVYVGYILLYAHQYKQDVLCEVIIQH